MAIHHFLIMWQKQKTGTFKSPQKRFSLMPKRTVPHSTTEQDETAQPVLPSLRKLVGKGGTWSTPPHDSLDQGSEPESRAVMADPPIQSIHP
ncbi:hypothetical protein Y1Q_0015429 [Alligator mississippiensis]|uniref:Uncharacterized protein n=1 Tax=Alligator mississippiensis TaxID=8496 RepID=A0A151NCU2_ALLMI|nr:hypothetical protein Y1Q_0015429 [Alligator mississippiensis]